MPPAEAFKAAMPVPGCWDDQFTEQGARVVAQGSGSIRSLLALSLSGDNPRMPRFPISWEPAGIAGGSTFRPRGKGGRSRSQVGRVVMEAWVYVNGREVHHHLGHSTNWEVPLGPHLAYRQAQRVGDRR